MLGRQISHYQILEALGEGGMGVVYKARDLRLDRLAALKFLSSQLASNQEQKERFILEAKAASSIDHPNIGSIYEIDETPDGHFFIAMAYYEGESLLQKIRRGPLPIKTVLDYAIQTAQGLAATHRHNILHRDLKPANILITNDGIAKIIDFGLAKLIHGAQITRAGSSLGTVAYMSPEQARGDEVSVKTDIWSLGVVMYEMLTGQRPFQGEFETAVMYSILNEDHQPVHNLRTDVPVDLERIIDRSLAKDPRNRYEQVQELLDDLLALRKDLDYGLESRSSRAVRDKSSPTRRGWKTISLASGAVLLLALVVSFLVKWLRPGEAGQGTPTFLAVVPFTNLGEPGDEYFAEGLTEELTNGLALLPRVLVIPRKSSSMYKESRLSDSTIASELGVRFLVRGKMQPTGGAIKIQATVFDARSGAMIDDEVFEKPRNQIYGLKDELISRVAGHAGLPSPPPERSPAPVSADVYDAYLHGIYYRESATREDNTLAMTFFGEALRKDSAYLPALLGLASADVEHYQQGWGRSPQLLSDAATLCERALRSDSNSSAAIALMGTIANIRGDPRHAIDLLLRALDKDRNNTVALTSLGQMYLFQLNDPAKGFMYLTRLQEIEPDWLSSLDLGVAYAQNKRYREAIRSFGHAGALNPRHEWPPYSMAYAYERMGELDSAVRYYSDALRKNAANPMTYEALASVLLATRRFAVAESVLLVGQRHLPNQPQIFYDLGVSYALEKKSAQARRAFLEGARLVEVNLRKEPTVGDHQAYAGLFEARLGNPAAAVRHAQEAVRLDSTNEEVILKATRVFAVLGRKERMLELFKMVRRMNPEYDAAYLSTALDFERYREDPDLLLLARQQ